VVYAATLLRSCPYGGREFESLSFRHQVLFHNGEVREWFMRLPWKGSIPVKTRGSRVRISPSPPRRGGRAF
jgi:hypothetical protein